MLAQILVARGWRKTVLKGQPRVIHPEGVCQLALTSARDVADPDHRVRPKTRRKGPATRGSLDSASPNPQLPLPLPEWVENEGDLPPKLKEAPLWFVLYEKHGAFLQLAIGRPAGMDESDRVVDWSDMIAISALDGIGDLTVFNVDDDGDIDVPVEPRD